MSELVFLFSADADIQAAFEFYESYQTGRGEVFMRHFRLLPQTDKQLQSLMDRNNDGLLQPAEKEELEALAALSEEISLLRAQALQLLGRQPA